MKKLIALIMVTCILSLSTTSVYRANENNESSTPDIISVLYQKGIISAEEVNNAEVVGMCYESGISTCSEDEMDNSFLGICVSYENEDACECEMIVPYIDDDGVLVPLSMYIENVADYRIFEQQISQIDFCTVKVRVSYNYYPQNWNNWEYPFYQHGTLNVRVDHDSVTANNYISNLEVRYKMRRRYL